MPNWRPTFDDALAGALVEAAHVALLADVERRVDEDLEEGQAGVVMDLARPVAVLNNHNNKNPSNQSKERIETR